MYCIVQPPSTRATFRRGSVPVLSARPSLPFFLPPYPYGESRVATVAVSSPSSLIKPVGGFHYVHPRGMAINSHLAMNLTSIIQTLQTLVLILVSW